ncbi:LytR/AlgR family response regulator transcription factor [Thomasclavelia sp.]
MITVAIIDNNQYFCDKIKNILLLNFDKLRTYTYNSVYQLDKEFDFIILSIDTPDYDGIKYAKTNEDKKILFVANHDYRYKEAFGPNVYGFISKDNLEKELVKNVSKMIDRIKNHHIINLKINGEMLDIQINSIIYCMYLGDMNIAIIFDNKQVIIKNKTLKELFKLLKNNFIQINRSVIVNKKKISKLTKEGIYLKGVNCLFDVSRRNKTLVLKAFYENNF